MTARTRKRIVLLGIAALVVAAVAYGFLPDAVPVETATVGRGPLTVIVEEEGEMHVADRFAVVAPVAGHARRMTLEVGDAVRAGDVVARLEAPRATVLDPRSRAEAASRAQAAEAALARAEAGAAQLAVDQARAARLAAAGAASAQAAERAATELAQARATVTAARAELAAARAALRPAAGPASLPVQAAVRAPAGGRVLAVHRRSEGPVAPGDSLVSIGDPGRLEVRAALLSQDAVRLRPGARVLVEQWGGDTALAAVVERVEPQAFTRVSALGVEEQRVRVVARLTSPPEHWRALGAGYRVLARFVAWEAADVVQLPTSALFRVGDAWAVFVVRDGRAERRAVAVGAQGGLAVQVLDGVAPGDTVVVHPGNDLVPGARVRRY